MRPGDAAISSMQSAVGGAALDELFALPTTDHPRCQDLITAQGIPGGGQIRLEQSNQMQALECADSG
jgi:hypothetical protein